MKNIEEESKDYLEGYVLMARELYGDNWKTCKFGWKPVLTINDKE